MVAVMADTGNAGDPGNHRAPDPPGESPVVGRVIGTEDSTPLEFWVGLLPDEVLQLDDVVIVDRVLPTGEIVRISGIVNQVRARHEGTRYDSDVHLVADGVLPAQVSEAAQVLATRFEPETFVPPLPGTEARRATGTDRDQALLFDRMGARLPVGTSRDGCPVFANFEFIDGRRGAHVNISGISGVATKTTYATFLLHGMFNSGVLGADALNTHVLVFNVKGEDLLHLDRPNALLPDDEHERYRQLGLPVGPFRSVGFWAPPRPGPSGVPDVSSRTSDVQSYFWTLEELCRDSLLPFLFADAEDDRQQYTMVVHNVAHRLQRDAEPTGDGAVRIGGDTVRTFDELCRVIEDRVTDDMTVADWAGRSMGAGTINAFVRRLFGAERHMGRLVRSDIANPAAHRIDPTANQVTVVDLHNLNDRAKRFVVGTTIRRAFDDKERSGQSRPLLFLVLDELNKYAPRTGDSPIKEILLDVAERGRSLGIILIGAQQTASEVERRIVANSAIRVVGRLDPAEAERGEYGFLPAILRRRATILKPGTMIVSQPELPIPLVVQFPFPAWATRAEEVVAPTLVPDDVFDGLPR
jgi:uncharacterized protein